MHNFVTDRRIAVPGAAQGDEGVVTVLRRKLLAGVVDDLHAGAVGGMRGYWRFGLRAEFGARHPLRLCGDLVVDLAIAAAEGPTVVVALDDLVNFLRRPIIAAAVAVVVPAEQCAA